MAIKAFLCSISEYDYLGQLPFCKEESKYVADALIRNLHIQQKDIYFATCSGGITNAIYMQKYKNFISHLSSDDIVIIYHSGHGGVDDEYNDLILYTTNSINSETGVASINLTTLLNKSNIINAIYLFDCCFSGKGIDNLKTIVDIEDTMLNRIGTGSAIITSCNKYQESHPYNSKISVFTNTIIDALNSRFVYKKGYFDLNEFKNMIAIYSNVWNRKNPDKNQNPLFRTNMFGMLRIPVSSISSYQQDTNVLEYDEKFFSLYDIKQHDKYRENTVLHTVTITAMIKCDYDESNISNLLQQIITFLLNSKTYKNSNIIWLYICNDNIDLDIHNYPYRCVWANKQQSYWLNNLGSKRVAIENLAWVKNQSYDMIKKLHLDNTMPDEDIIDFWKDILEKMIQLSTQAINSYHSYRNSDISFTELCTSHSVLLKQALPLCYKADDAPFPLPDSQLKGFDKNIQFVSGNVRELFLYYGCKNDRDEKNRMDCFEIFLNRYYTDLYRIKEFAPFVNI